MHQREFHLGLLTGVLDCAISFIHKILGYNTTPYMRYSTYFSGPGM